MKNGCLRQIDIIVAHGMSDGGTGEILQLAGADHSDLRVLDDPSRMLPVATNLGPRETQRDAAEIVDLAANLRMGNQSFP